MEGREAHCVVLAAIYSVLVYPLDREDPQHWRTGPADSASRVHAREEGVGEEERERERRQKKHTKGGFFASG